MATTRKPTGLKITRKGDKYIFSWSKPQSYGDGQQLQWSYKASSTHKSSIIKLSGSKKNYTVNSPSKLSEISFKVRGNHDQNRNDPGWSDWASESFKVHVAKQPKITATWEDATPNKTVFKWEVEDEEHYPFDHVEYRTMLVQDYNGHPSSYDWASVGSPSTSTSKTGTIFDTPESVDPSESWTRIVQIRAIGAGGAPKKWKYATHTYAKPNEPFVYKAEATPIPLRVTTSLDMEWLNNEDSAHPVDKTIIQYKMVTPASGMVFPPQETPDDADTPVNTEHFDDWHQGNTWAEEIAGLLAEDQCLFARIKVTHDTREEVSQFKIAQYGRLSAPSNVSITPIQGTHTITVNATNESDVPDSYMAIIYKKDGTESILGVIPNGSSSVNMVVPAWTDSVGDVGVYAVVGNYTAQPADADGVVVYTIAKPLMTSDKVWKGGIGAPSISVVQASVEETATVTWDWIDPDATGAEVSWANHEDAWESTDEPDTYIVDANRSSRLNVSGLEAGITWYFRVRLVTEGDETSYGLYSDIFALNLSSAPSKPTIELADQVIETGKETIASWVYISGDNTPQKHATLLIYENGTYLTAVLADTEQTAVINPSALELPVGSYQISVKVQSESEQWSEESDLIPFSVADPLTCAITQASLVSRTKTIEGDTYTFPYCLAEMPMTVTVTGAGETGETTLTIRRNEDYSIAKPDNTELTGYQGEIIYQDTYRGEAQHTIDIGDVIGKLNDGATYYIEASVADNLGRVSEPVRYPADDPDNFFTVIWDEQAIMPDATAEIVDDDYAKLTITKPQDWYAGDVVDVYRLTSEKPQKILENVEMDDDPVEYVDPFPTLGQGGYRFVYKTKNGDDTLDSANNFAWLNIPLALDSSEAIIDFNGERLPLGYNLKVSNSWAKDFQETKYLGGHIAGDWTVGTARTGAMDAVALPIRDAALFASIRRLAEFEGVCHLRTLDGAVIICNIDVNDDFGYDTAGKIQNVKLSFTRIDAIDLDGVLLTDWKA